MGSAETIAFAIYLLIGPAFWLVMLWGFTAASLRLGKLRRASPPLPASPPSVSIVVPAKDEAAHIQACVSSLLGQDYPRFDVRVIDDRSSDDTRERLAEMQTQRARTGTIPPLTVRHVDQLPAGWLGKCHALHSGTRDLNSEWVLFVDSDVRLEPDALRRTMALAIDRQYDAVSILTRLDGRTFLENLMVPVCAAAWATMFMLSWTNDDNRPNAVANGQFFLVRRRAYESVGGHECVKMQIVEDVELMRALKRSGAKCRLFNGSHLAATRMHATWDELLRGWGRIYAGTARYRRGPIIAAISVVLACGVAIYPMLLVAVFIFETGGGSRWLWAALIHLALLSTFLLLIYHACRARRVYAALAFLSLPLLIRLLIEGARKCRVRRFEWRGTAVDLHS